MKDLSVPRLLQAANEPAITASLFEVASIEASGGRVARVVGVRVGSARAAQGRVFEVASIEASGGVVAPVVRVRVRISEGGAGAVA